MTIILNVPPQVALLHQQGLLERAFHDGLFPGLLFRGEALAEEFPANTGVEMFQSKPGLLAPATAPLQAGTEPTPKSVNYEQWIVRLDRFGDTIDTDMPTSVTANSDLLMRNIHQLGLQAGQTLNRLPRNSLYRSYLAGQTSAIASATTSDSTLRVAALSGFLDVVTSATVRPTAVSPATPLPITIYNATPITANVVGVSPDNPSDLNGPGTLILSTTLSANVAARTPVVSAYAAKIIRSGGGFGVDAITASDTLVFQDLMNAVTYLRTCNVQPHDDGFYHCHLPAAGEAQLFIDPAMQRLYQGNPNDVAYKQGYMGQLAGQRLWSNNECPNVLTAGNVTSTGTNARYSSDIAAETVNDNNIRIGRAIVTGKGCIYEKYLDEKLYISEAGITGKVAEFTTVNNGISVMVDRVRLVIRSPIDRLMDKVSATWSYTGDFPIPSDITYTQSGNARFKRACVIEFADMQ